MCRTGQAAQEGVVQHRLNKEGFFAAVNLGEVPSGEGDSATFRAVMDLPSLTRRERAIANRVPGKKFVDGRSVRFFLTFPLTSPSLFLTFLT
jgi:hypothetical protein